MTALPGPLDQFRVDGDHPAGEAIAWVLGGAWPAGDETAIREVADRWHAAAADLAEVASGDEFADARQRLAGTPDALAEIAHELGEWVEQCGRDVEAAKLAALIETGLFLTELTGLAITAPLALGAAVPAADALTMATRIALRQILDDLEERLAAPARASSTRSDAPTRRLRPPAPDVGAPRVPDTAAASPRRGRHARDTSESGSLRARRAAKTQRLPRPAKPSSPDETGPGTVTRRVSPSELERLAEALIRRDQQSTRRRNTLGHLDRVAAQVRAKSAEPARAAGATERADEHHAAAVDADTLAAETALDAARPPARHQRALEDAMPRDGEGRLPDPRTGRWSALDGVLALYDSYLHGRPRTAAGKLDRPAVSDRDGVRQIERTTGSAFQNLCPFLGGADPAAAREAVDAAMLNLANHLHNSGHGSFAFIVTDLEGGSCHSWAAVNQDGVILFLDPRTARISEEVPIYAHQGAPADDNVVAMDALVVDGHGRPAPLPFHGPGLRSSTND